MKTMHLIGARRSRRLSVRRSEAAETLGATRRWVSLSGVNAPLPLRPAGALRSTNGSLLIISVVASALIGAVLSSYLMLIAHRNHSVMRAMAWNNAIPVLEAGIEDSLTHLNLDMQNPTANGWQKDEVNGQTVYWKHRQLPDGSYYFVTNFNADAGSTAPVIHSAGYVQAPLANGGEYISRLVEVTATNPASPFLTAIAANGLVNLGGFSVVDGYDPNFGDYDVTTNRNASGVVATDSQAVGAIDAGTAHVYGRVVTGPGGTVVVTAGGAVGDIPWNNSGSTGIQPNTDPPTQDDNMNTQFMDNSAPAGTPISPQYVTGGGSNMTVLGNGYYSMPSFNSNTRFRPMIVTAGTHAILYVTGNFMVQGGPNNAGYVEIEPGATLTLYVGGTASISGGGIVNMSRDPNNFSYVGLPSNTSLNYSGAARFYGTINAPEANFNIAGGAQVFGAIICNTFTSGGNSGVHYNQALAGPRQFLVTSWREL